MRRPQSWQLNTTLVKCVCETPLQKPAAWNSVLKGHLHLCKGISVGQLFHCLNLNLHPYGGSTCLPVGGRSLDRSLTSEGAKRLWMMDTLPHRVISDSDLLWLISYMLQQVRALCVCNMDEINTSI